jgi:4-hydroxybenzoate polyprenyltransferase
MKSQHTNRLTPVKAWMQLLRPPNLLTVPGDPIAGFFLAQWLTPCKPLVAAWPCVAGSFLLYMAGLISNDYFDLKEDSAQRPNRPLPSGAVKPAAAIAVTIVLAALGIGSASFAGVAAAIVAASLAATIAVYNIWLKKVPIIGPFCMGSCRGLSLLLGAAFFGQDAVFSSLPLLAAAGITFYVTAVTRIAASETEEMEIGGDRWRPLINIGLCFTAIMFFVESSSRTKLTAAGGTSIIVAGLAALMTLFWALYCGTRLTGEPEPAVVSTTVGKYLRGLLFAQAAFVALAGNQGLLVAAALLLLWPVSMIFGKWFYAS